MFKVLCTLLIQVTVYTESRKTSFQTVSELSEKNRLLIESFHGWDNICRGGLLFPHPGAPSICVPAPRLSGGVQVTKIIWPADTGDVV